MRVSWSNTDLCLSDLLPKCHLACMVRWRRNFKFWAKFTLQVTSLMSATKNHNVKNLLFESSFSINDSLSIWSLLISLSVHAYLLSVGNDVVEKLIVLFDLLINSSKCSVTKGAFGTSLRRRQTGIWWWAACESHCCKVFIWYSKILLDLGFIGGYQRN